MTTNKRSASAITALIGACLLGFVLPVGRLFATPPTRPLLQEDTSAPCRPSLNSCPESGCSDADSAHGLMNQIKHHTPAPGTELHRLTFDDFDALQTAAEERHVPMGRGTAIDNGDRFVKLHDILLPSGDTVSEGDLVQLVGFISADDKNPRANTKESVNCNLRGQPNNDFHINLVERDDDSEFDGIVAEMIPQDRLDKWSLKTLRLVRRASRKVLVRGQLFFDNMHRPRTNPDADPGGNSPRFSLWEIHPITDFRVCMRPANTCSPLHLSQWKKLEDVMPASLRGTT